MTDLIKPTEPIPWWKIRNLKLGGYSQQRVLVTIEQQLPTRLRDEQLRVENPKYFVDHPLEPVAPEAQ